jgi:N-acyl-phosphatidylethanolamine-hydrolysing phospholipase D
VERTLLRLALAGLLALSACRAYAPAEYPPEQPVLAEPSDPGLLYLAYESDGRFFNPWRPFETGPFDFLQFVLSRNPYRGAAAAQTPVRANDGAELAGRQGSAKLTWVGHATFVIHDGDDVVLTDPHFGPRALLPGRAVPPGVPLAAIPGDALAVISHNHYDHLDAWTVERLPATVAWFVPRGLGAWFRERGRADVAELGWWESARRGRWTVTCLPSQHWSRRLGQGTNETLWCAWLLDSGEHRYFFAGDTGYFHGFAEYGRRFAPIDVALLPIGAYEPRWFMGYQHMDPAEAWQAFRDLGARTLLPMHWGTFQLTHEPLDRPPLELRRVVAAAAADPARAPILAVGEAWHVPGE